MQVNLTITKMRLEEGVIKGSVAMTNATIRKHFPFEFEVRRYGQPDWETIITHKKKEFLHQDADTDWESLSPAQQALSAIFNYFEPIIDEAQKTWEGSKKMTDQLDRGNKEIEAGYFEYLESDTMDQNELTIPEDDPHIKGLTELFNSA